MSHRVANRRLCTPLAGASPVTGAAWTTTTDVVAFPAEAGASLELRPLEHAVLLTEAAYVAAH